MSDDRKIIKFPDPPDPLEQLEQVAPNAKVVCCAGCKAVLLVRDQALTQKALVMAKELEIPFVAGRLKAKPYCRECFAKL